MAKMPAAVVIGTTMIFAGLAMVSVMVLTIIRSNHRNQDGNAR